MVEVLNILSKREIHWARFCSLTAALKAQLSCLGLSAKAGFREGKAKHFKMILCLTVTNGQIRLFYFTVKRFILA